MSENPQKLNEPVTPPSIPPHQGEGSKTLNKWAMIHLASELGFIIALPLVAFALLGKWLDRRFDTYPLMTLIGIAFAITSTTIWMVRRLKGYINK